MKRLKGFQDSNQIRGCVLSIGNFDGVHRGHQAILGCLNDLAHEHSVPSMVMTFEPHPVTLLNPAFQPPRLTTAAQKAELIAKLGIDFVLEYPTDWELLQLTPREFFDKIILEKLDARGLVEGPNFFFGKDRAGNGQVLEEFCLASGRLLKIVSPTLFEGTIVSSSLIREALTAGDVQQAATFLGRNYAVSGIVANGAQRGRTIGFPTANVSQIETLLPADGVYAAIFQVGESVHQAAVSVGPNPTFADGERKVEAHLLDFSGDLYGQEIEIRFVSRVRGLQHFESASKLQQQISKDVAEITSILKAVS